MLGWLLNREVVIGLAILGAIMVASASLLAGRLGPARAVWLNRAGYTVTGVSVLIFIVVGFMGPR
ncbi:MAG: hypothetical protein ACOZDY_02405 [Pseudomonadota bacterium]